MPDQVPDDVFAHSGQVRPGVADAPTLRALRESLTHARNTNWDSVRTPHLFMGLLAAPDSGVRSWAGRLNADQDKLLDQFRELFYQDADPCPPLQLHREFLSDNVIRVIRDASARANEHGRDSFTQMDLLITLFRAPNGIVAECFERIGVSAAQLTEMAMRAEQETSEV